MVTKRYKQSNYTNTYAQWAGTKRRGLRYNYFIWWFRSFTVMPDKESEGVNRYESMHCLVLCDSYPRREMSKVDANNQLGIVAGSATTNEIFTDVTEWFVDWCVVKSHPTWTTGRLGTFRWFPCWDDVVFGWLKVRSVSSDGGRRWQISFVPLLDNINASISRYYLTLQPIYSSIYYKLRERHQTSLTGIGLCIDLHRLGRVILFVFRQ